MNFSERLQELQAHSKVSKIAVVRATGIPRTTYYYYLQGRQDPPTSALIALADYFNVSIDYLIGRTDDPHGQAISPSPPDPPAIKRIKEKLLTLDTNALKEVERYVDFIKSTE